MTVKDTSTEQDESISKSKKTGKYDKKKKKTADDIKLSNSSSTDVINLINKEIGGEVAQRPKDKPTIIIQSGILSMDLAVGNGGMIGGRVMDIYGWEGTGKTLVCLTIAGYVQKCTKKDAAGNIINKKVAFLDAEGTFSKLFAQSAGVNTDELILVQSTPKKIISGEEFFDAMMLCLQLGVDFIILDSCPALVPTQVLVNEMGQGQKATNAQLMSEGVKKASTFASATGSSIVSFINQKRNKPMAGMHEKPEQETGGNALKFYSTYRFEVVGHEAITKNVLCVDGQYRPKIVGANSKVRIIKNKTCALPQYLPGTTYNFDYDVYFEDFIADDTLEYRCGVDVVKDYVDTGIRTGVIEQNSSWFKFGSINTNGKPAFIHALKQNPEVLEEIRSEVFKNVGMIDTK